MKSDRPFIIGIAILAGIFLGNLGWVLPSAVAIGGDANIAACILLPTFGLLMITLLWVGPKWPE